MQTTSNEPGDVLPPEPGEREPYTVEDVVSMMSAAIGVGYDVTDDPDGDLDRIEVTSARMRTLVERLTATEVDELGLWASVCLETNGTAPAERPAVLDRLLLDMGLSNPYAVGLAVTEDEEASILERIDGLMSDLEDDEHRATLADLASVLARSSRAVRAARQALMGPRGRYWTPAGQVAAAYPEHRVSRLGVESLLVELTDEERLVRADELARAQRDLEAHAAHEADVRAGLKAVRVKLEVQISRLSGVVSTGAELRSVPTVDLVDLGRGLGVVVRQDTLEVLRTRPLTDAERQGELIP